MRERIGRAHENEAVRRMVATLERVVGSAPSGTVPLRLLGRALAEPTGGRFDDRERNDRELLARVLDVFGPRFWQLCWELRDVSASPPKGAVVSAWRRPARSTMRLRGWGEVASRAELARWSARADRPQRSEHGPAQLVARLVPDADPADRAAVAALRHRVQPWPPLVMSPGDGRPVEPSPGRPLVVRNGLAAAQGCAQGEDDVPCVVARRGRWTCRRCGASIPVPEPVPGKRLAACVCWGEVVCVHPLAPRVHGASPSVGGQAR
ncbi:hypothetical protein ACU61A_12505 [Pseudonocardia sichuanensis]